MYAACTASFGDFGGSGILSGGITLMGPGKIMMWFLAAFSWVPILVHSVYSRTARNEKKHFETSSSSDEEQPARSKKGPKHAAAAAPQYGATAGPGAAQMSAAGAPFQQPAFQQSPYMQGPGGMAPPPMS